MHDGYISKVALGVIALWVVVLCTMVGAWLVILLTPAWQIAGMMAASACVLSGFTATIQNRVYTSRVCDLIRLTRGLDGPDSSPSLRLMS